MRKILKSILVLVVILIIYLVVIPATILQYGRNRIYKQISSISQYDIAIVFGAGIKDNEIPNDMLKDRLDTAHHLYLNGKVEKLLLSGDNSADDYNEPQVMYDYLVFTLNMPPEDAVRDFAGLRTYDTCARAKNIWNVDKALLISQGYHLSRAIFTCSRLGIESTGYSATTYPYVGETYYKIREVLAIHKALLDVYILHPEYIGGEPELDFEN